MELNKDNMDFAVGLCLLIFFACVGLFTGLSVGVSIVWLTIKLLLSL